MRKIFLLLSLVSVLGACQKKQYATFNYQSPTAYNSQKSAATTSERQDHLAVAITPEILSASTGEVPLLTTSAEIAATRILAEAVRSSTAPVQTKAASSTLAQPTQLTFTQKVVAKKVQRQIKRSNAPQGRKAVKEKTDTISLLSLVFGGGGLVLLLLGRGLGSTVWHRWSHYGHYRFEPRQERSGTRFFQNYGVAGFDIWWHHHVAHTLRYNRAHYWRIFLVSGWTCSHEHLFL